MGSSAAADLRARQQQRASHERRAGSGRHHTTLAAIYDALGAPVRNAPQLLLLRLPLPRNANQT
jgi:hypothetical protein